MVAVELDGRWTVVGHLNGGYLAALVAEQVSAAFEGAPALTISAHYLANADGGDLVDVVMEVVRRARLSTARVRFAREGTVLLESVVACGEPRPTETSIEAAVPPHLPPWQECVDGAEAMSGPENELMRHLSVRLHPEDAAAMTTAMSASTTAGHVTAGTRARATVAYRDGAPSDRFLAAAAWDVLPPCAWAGGLRGYLPTVAAQVVIYAESEPGPLVVEARCDTVRHGIVDETARVWDETGALVSSSRQTAVFIPFRT